jgi:GTP cyclohydrolase II
MLDRAAPRANTGSPGGEHAVEVMDLESAAASMVSVDRAVGDLRRGDFVMLESAGGVALAQAAETVTAASLATLTRLANGNASLALTARRASVLAFPKAAAAGRAASGVVTLPLAGIGDPETIRCLIDPTALRRGRLPTSVTPRQERGDSFAAAAVALSKLAQLLPAALTATLTPDEAAQGKWLARHRHLLRVEVGAIADYARLAAVTLQPVSEARVPLDAAEDARVVGFRPADGSAEQFAIVIGDPAAHQPALCRVHSECFTGDLLGSLRCDCGAQLQQAIALMGAAGHGVLLYLAHEGRGIGLINKLRAYQLQDAGLDTLDANQHLGFEPDERSYRGAAVMLRHLGIQSVRLLTNNPAKVEALAREGVSVVERIPHATAPNRHNVGYLTTKASRSGHLL